MTDPSDPKHEHATEALCPECRLELTGSKVVETLRARRPDGEEKLAHVFYCPECGRFFEIDAEDEAH